MNAVDELPPLHQVAAQVRAAHERAVALWADRKKVAHPRNLAGLVLVRKHGADPAETWNKMGISRTMGDQELLPGAGVDEVMPDWSRERCEQVIAAKRAELEEIKTGHEQAVRERREGVARMALGQVTGEPVADAEIARLTGMSLQQIAADMKKTRQGIPELAKMLSVQEARVRAVLDRAREAGIEWPPHDTAPLLFDPVAFKTWWDEHRFGWGAADQHAGDMGMDLALVAELLEVAEEIGDLPEHADDGGERLFEPGAFRAWWAGRMRDQQEISEGWAGATALAYEARVPVGVLLTRLSEAKKGRRLPEHRKGTRGRLYNVEAVREFLDQRGQSVDPRFVPVSQLAELVDEPEHVVAAWLREAEQRGIPLPEYNEGARWRRYKREAFLGWWRETRERTRNGELASLPELARLLDTSEKVLAAGLAEAEDRGVVMPPGEHRMFEVAAMRIWWPAWEAAVSAGTMEFLGIAALAGRLDQPVEKVKRQVKAALERGRPLPPHRLSARGHREFEVSAYQQWRRIVGS